MNVYWSPHHALHSPEFFMQRGIIKRHHERPERVETLLSAVKGIGAQEIALTFPGDTPPEDLLSAVQETHDADYVAFILGGHRLWSELPGAGPEMVPGIRPITRAETVPIDIAGQVGRYVGDLASPIGAGTGVAALSAGYVAIHASRDMVAQNLSLAYALCRPCGHHNTKSVAGGGCYFNNIALAVHALQADRPRIAVLDIDAHHGNGTQAHFYDRSDVLTVSIHADPGHFYPFYWGYAHETGIGAGEGFNLNLPVPVGTGDGPWLKAVRAGLDRVAEFAPDMLIVALGQDPHKDDPLGAMQITDSGFAQAGWEISDAGLQTLVVQEGGYLSENLGPATQAFFDGFLATAT